MRISPNSRDSVTRVDRLLARIARQIEAEQVLRASRNLERVLALQLDRRERFLALSLEAECCLVSRRFNAARNSIDKAQELVFHPVEQDRIDLTKAHLLGLIGEIRESFTLVKSVLRRSDPLVESRARALWIAGLACYRGGHYDWANRCFQMSSAYYRLTGRNKLLAHVLINLALVAKSKGNLVGALSYLDEAAGLVPGEGHSKTRLRLLVNRGICLCKLGDVGGARACFMEAKSLASQDVEPIFMIMVHNNLGHIFKLESNHRIAVEFYSQALEMARREASPRQECLALEFLGEVYGEQGRHREALRCLDQAYVLARQLAGKGDLMMEVLRRRGEVYAAIGDLTHAERDLTKAIELCRSRGERREQALAQRAHALCFAPSTETLVSSMRETLEILRKLGDRFEFARTVCLILEGHKIEPEHHSWMTECVATATHYFVTLGLDVWKLRLQRLTGPAYSPDRMRDPVPLDLSTRSSLYGLALEAAQLAARGREPVLIQGETGAGKEVIAGLVHSWSSRAEGPFIGINCGALPETLVESELFGHMRGSFTGADRDKTGLLETAAGGTILLDEIADLPPHTQVKLLRFLDTGEIRRLGDTKTRKVDLRVLAATNKDLSALVRQSRFREDLFYRLNVFKISVPSLRERREDILPLAERFLLEAAQGQRPAILSDEVRDWLVRYDWPGNVRQLRNLCAYLATRAWGKPEVTIRDLPSDLPIALTGVPQDPTLSAFEREKKDLERAQVVRALRETQGHISKAAKLLGMGRNVLSRRMREIGIDPDSFR